MVIRKTMSGSHVLQVQNLKTKIISIITVVALIYFSDMGNEYSLHLFSPNVEYVSFIVSCFLRSLKDKDVFIFTSI